MAKLALDNAEWLSTLSEPLKNDIESIMTQRLPSEGDCLLKEAGAGNVTGFLHVVGHHDDDMAFANVIAGKDAKVWIVRGEEFRAITENPQHTTEMMNLLTRLLRKASKIVRATLNETGVRVGRSSEGTGRTIKIMCYDTTSWNFEPQIEKFNNEGKDLKLQMDYTSDRLDVKTAKYAAGYDAVCLFVTTIRIHPHCGYYPWPDSGLLGMDIHGKTVAVMGTGKIGQILCKIISGFGVNLLAYDVFESDEVKNLGGTYVSKEEIYKQADVIFLMMPLLPATTHTINEDVLPMLKKGVILINTSRGGLIDTNALISGLHSGIIGGCGLDVKMKENTSFRITAPKALRMSD
ncbi:D-lactate dehydrogenase-related protein [Skeletonema marinoi]|uniref:D-lactate dehydrogenase-related protein n=1 Tax=Skeletonema marinoi TaxID=267567 RepID=A0AAD8YNS2_9STRA|nr:D-lactate dehydrogenase-related protein [Skeletonema marinoi]